MTPATETQYLVVVSSVHRCVLALADVVEVMRPLRIDAVAQSRAFVRGLSVIRGAAVPVVDLLALLEPGRASATFGRFVSLGIGAEGGTGHESGERRFVLAVDQVLGVTSITDDRLADLDPLLRENADDVVASVVRSDAQLHRVLRSARIVPADVWRSLASEGAPT